jgi:phosphoribosylformylglycinamidine synthase
MCIGNKIGFTFGTGIDKNLFATYYGSFIVELKEDVDIEKMQLLGKTTAEIEIVIPEIVCSKDVCVNSGELSLNIDELIEIWKKPLENVFPTKVNESETSVKDLSLLQKEHRCNIVAHSKFATPRVFIPIFPGTNCEYDSIKAFEDAGATVVTGVFKNLRPSDIEDTVTNIEKEIQKSQIVMLAGGFSAADEPDGSGKFINTVFRNQKLKDVVNEHLYTKDGLMIGICNGFQALIKLGLVPYGKITELSETSPTLTFNKISRHQSRFVTTKVVSKLSPWFSSIELGQDFVIPISHGEGRFIANETELQTLIANGQVATQYVDLNGNPSMDIQYNPNGSDWAIEGITSKDGRILGKMGHSERCYRDGYKNIIGNKNQRIFESGVNYYK